MKPLSNIYQGIEGTSLERELSLLRKKSIREKKKMSESYNIDPFILTTSYDPITRVYSVKIISGKTTLALFTETNKEDLLKKISKNYKKFFNKDVPNINISLEEKYKELFKDIISSINKNPSFYYVGIFGEKYREEFAEKGVDYICLKNYKSKDMDIKKYPYNLILNQLLRGGDIDSPDTLHYLKNSLLIIYFIV